MTHNRPSDETPTGENPVFQDNPDTSILSAGVIAEETDYTSKRRGPGKGVLIPAALAGIAVAVAGAVYLSEDEPAAQETDPTPVATAEPSPKPTPTEERTVPRPSPRPTETTPAALPETPAELQEIAAMSLTDFRHQNIEPKLAFYNWLEEKYGLAIPSEVSTDPTVFNESDPLTEIAYVINEAVPHILEHDTESAVPDAQKLASFAIAPIRPDETSYPEELEQWHDALMEQITLGETIPFEYEIEKSIFQMTDMGYFIEVVTETDGETVAYGLRRIALPDENDPDVYHGTYRLVGMGEPTDETPTPVETQTPESDMAAYESLSADEFLNTVDENTRPAYGEYLLNKHGLELPYQIPESVEETSPQGLVDNYNFIMESVPLIYDEEGVEEAKKLVWSLFSPQPGDVIDPESQPHNVSWETEFRIFEQLKDPSFADPNSRLRQRWVENERRELSRPDLGLNPRVLYDGYEIWTGVEGYAQSTERTDLWRFVTDKSGNVYGILVGINTYEAVIDTVM